MNINSLDTEIYLLLRSIETGLRKADLPEIVSRYLDKIYSECTAITIFTESPPESKEAVHRLPFQPHA
ncbi:hypothetical protein IU821_004851 [Salmonella enterica]|nr:hypothetical protein [Salmonella enterica]